MILRVTSRVILFIVFVFCNRLGVALVTPYIILFTNIGVIVQLNNAEALTSFMPKTPIMQKAAIRLSNGEIGMGEKLIATPKTGQVLLRVMAAAINPVDYKLPYLIVGKHVGIDVAGIVTAVPSSNSIWKVGDEVFGFATDGSLAEYAVVDEMKLARKPASLEWLEAAALPTAYATSYQALSTHGHLKAGQSLLIIGASGGCGTAGLDLASAMKATPIVAVCSAANIDLVKQLGATSVVDYSDAAAYEAFKSSSTSKFDLVYDCASGSGKNEWYLDDARRNFLKPGGKIVAINGGAWQWIRALTKLQSKELQLMLTDQNGTDLEALLVLLGNNSNNFRPTIDSTYPLTSKGIALGFERQKSRHARGKIVYIIGCASTDDGSAPNIVGPADTSPDIQ
jgi:NADPH:quinone reductase-like Zn-dependent oxidoreductase